MRKSALLDAHGRALMTDSEPGDPTQTTRPANADPCVWQLSRNMDDIGRSMEYYARKGIKDVACWCIMTKDKGMMATIANATGVPCVPDENDAEGQGGTAGSGLRSTVVDMLKKLFGSQHELVKGLQNWRPGGGRVPVVVRTPDGYGGILELRGK